MPYHYQQVAPSFSHTSWDFKQYSPWGLIDLPQWHQFPGFSREYNAAAETRGGQNSQPSLARKVRKLPSVRIRKKTIGMEKVNFVKKSYKFVNGKRIQIRKIVSFLKPIKTRYASISVPSSKEILESKSLPLFPNRLSYARQTCSLSPCPLGGEFSFELWDGVSKQVGYWEVTGPGQHEITPCYVGFYTGTAELISALQNPGAGESSEKDTLYRLYKKVGSSTPSLLTALGESPEIVQTIGKILSEGLLLARALLRFNFRYIDKKIASNLDIKSISSLWLEWVYGIAPTLSDLSQTLEVLADKEKLWRVYKTSGSVEVELDSPFDPDTVTDFFHGETKLWQKDTTKFGVILPGRLSFEKYTNTRVKTFAAVVSSAYELAPFSFMLDWFIDIGGYLSSAKVLSEQEYYCWRTRTRSYSDYWNGHLGQSHYNPGQYIFSPEFKASRSYFVCQRDLLESLPDMPMPSVARISNLFDMSSFTRSVNALAIAITRMK